MREPGDVSIAHLAPGRRADWPQPDGDSRMRRGRQETPLAGPSIVAMLRLAAGQLRRQSRGFAQRVTVMNEPRSHGPGYLSARA